MQRSFMHGDFFLSIIARKKQEFEHGIFIK